MIYFSALLALGDTKILIERILKPLISQGVEVCVLTHHSNEWVLESEKIPYEIVNCPVRTVEFLSYRNLIRICRNDNSMYEKKDIYVASGNVKEYYALKLHFPKANILVPKIKYGIRYFELFGFIKATHCCNLKSNYAYETHTEFLLYLAEKLNLEFENVFNINKDITLYFQVNSRSHHKSLSKSEILDWIKVFANFTDNIVLISDHDLSELNLSYVTLPPDKLSSNIGQQNVFVLQDSFLLHNLDEKYLCKTFVIIKRTRSLAWLPNFVTPVTSAYGCLKIDRWV